LVACALSIALVGCGGGDDDDGAGNTGTGGTLGSGGSTAPGTGGTAAGSGGTSTAGESGKGGAGGTSGGGTGGTSGGGTGGTNAGDAGPGGDPEPMALKCSMPKPNPTVGNACKGAAPPGLKLTKIVDGLQGATFVTQAPGDPSRLYVLEQKGTIRIVKDGALQPMPLLDLGDLTGANAINATGVGTTYVEAGLLGMAFAPDFETSHRFYLDYTKGASDFTTTILELKMDDPDVVDATSAKEIKSVSQPSFNHKGGSIAFGPDGCLFVSMGDGGEEGDPSGTGQGTNDELAVILRLDVDNPMTPAPGNLSGNIWSTGFRNVWRMSFDRETGDLYMGDVGQDQGSGFEELNVEPRGVAGRNYGWSIQEGSTCHGGADCSMTTTPALDYQTSATANSVIGGYVYRGKAVPELVGRYLWADWTERKIKSFIFKGETGGQPEICDEFDTGLTTTDKIRAFGQDNDGELYVLAGGTPGGGLVPGTDTSGASLTVATTLYKIEKQ
jgi:glucose/arabinose dehydrogenase